MKNQLKDYFYFNSNERKGIISLVALMLLFIAGKEFLIYFSPTIKNDQELIAKLQAEVDSSNEIANNKKQQRNSFLKESELNQDSKTRTFPTKVFNPNNLTLKDWQEYGLSEKQANVILNYKEKANGFKSKSQLKKMFVISDELYSKMEQYIDLPDTFLYTKNNKFESSNYQSKKYTENKKWKPRVYQKVYINSADTAKFKSLYGIGKVLAERIVKRREELGGFIDKNQLSEIYGLSKETLENLDTLLIFNAIEINQLSINSSTIEELKKHPYIFWRQANSIVKFKKQHGNYKSIEDIKKSVLINDSIFNKIKPYIKL